FLQDAELYDLVGRLILKKVRDEAFAEDVHHGAYVVAMHLVMKLKGPIPGTERAWVCGVARIHTLAELRRRKKKEEAPLAKDEAPELPVADQQTLHEEQLYYEKLLDAAASVAANHVVQVEEVLAADARTKEGGGAGPKDAAARKRKERTRTAL